MVTCIPTPDIMKAQLKKKKTNILNACSVTYMENILEY